MWLWDAWFNPNSFYSYCVVVPFISGIIAYQSIKTFGFKLNELLFPLFFLVFMFPLPDGWTSEISHKLTFVAAGLSTLILNSLQIHAVQQGNIIEMRHASTVVNDACSGIRAIISLLAMGSVFAYWMKAHISRKVFLIVSVIPIALFVNAIRIVFLSVVAEFCGAKYTIGFVHNVAGLLLYGIAFIFLFNLSRLLSLGTASSG